jgi:hypothetical protein
MKKLLIILPLVAVVGMVFAFAGKSLVGHWKARYGNGPTGHVLFRSNGTAEATFDGETWKVGGPYKVQGSTVALSDSSCGLGYWARYNATWYSDDSVGFKVIADSCSGRKANVDGAVIIREK